MPRQFVTLTRTFLAGCLALAASLVLTSSATVGSKIFLVDSAEDVADANPGDGLCATLAGMCSLRAAIEEANAREQNDSIILPGGQNPWTYTLNATFGTLEISTSMSIQSPDRVGLRVIDGQLLANTPVLSVNATGVLISGLMIHNGPLGGLVVEPGAELTLSESTLSQNAISGILNQGGTLTLNNVTLSGNVGAGLINQNSSALTQLNNSTVISNTGLETGGIKTTSGSVILKNSVVAGNSTLGGAPDCLGVLSSAGHNLLGNPAGCEGLVNGINGDLVGSEVAPLEARLAPLAENGGPSTTHALLPDSPALNAGATCLSKDQRGVPRPQSQACDMGAFEVAMAQLSASDYAQLETAPAIITVTLDAALPFEANVAYQTFAGSAQPDAEFTPVSGTLTFTNTAQLAFTVPLTPNALYTGDKWFDVVLTNTTSLGVDSPAIARVTIVDAEAPPVAEMESSLQSMIKSTQQVVVTATLDTTSGVTATVNYHTVDDTALAGRDYLAKSGQLQFAPGETAKPITLTVLNDGMYYGDRSFSVQLTEPVSATLGTPESTSITIVDTNPRRIYLPLIFRPPEGYVFPCETEPNDNASQANGPLLSGRDYCGTLANGVNNDFFYFKSNGGPLTVQLTGATTGVQLQLYYPTVSVANLVGFTSSAPFTITCPPGSNNKCTGAAGTYYVRIVTTALFGGGAYSLRVTFP
ncbi:MAG: CSLREA domain-containing protein [Anaerolineales bacterium]|nr:CSLREA domain-containing protein [Anaerolineales bacterium]